MIIFQALTSDLERAECHIFRRGSGRFELFCDGEEDPSLEGDDAGELEEFVLARGAGAVHHWYAGGRCNPVCRHRSPIQ